MRAGKSISRAKSDASSRNGTSDGNKGLPVAGTRNNLSSESDDDNVRQQLALSPASRRTRSRSTTAHRQVGRRRNGLTVGPGSDSDNRGSELEHDHLRQTSSTRNGVRRAGTDSPATTPVRSANQTPGPATSSSESVPRQPNGMDVDSEGDDPVRRSSDEGPERGPDARSSDMRATEAGALDEPFKIAFIPCHTFPPCAVCAGIAGQPAPRVAVSSFMVTRHKQLALAREAARNAPVIRPVGNGPNMNANIPPTLRPLPLARPSDPSARPEFVPPPLSPPPMPYDPPPAHPSRSTENTRSEASMAPRTTYPASVYPPPPSSYPMEPLFVSAGVAPQGGRTATTVYQRGAMGQVATAGMHPPPSTSVQHVIRQVTLSSVSAHVRHSPYVRPQRTPQQAQQQPSSSSLRIEDIRTPQNASGPRLRGRGKQRSKKVRAKRYNRKKREEWPPEGWNPIWEEERPRRWEGYDLPDDVPTDKVYEHLRRKFDLKSMGHCKWEGCIPTDASKDGYKMLKRHVETVHLGLKLVCRLCGVRKRADNRRKATHKRGCPEREDGTIAMPPEEGGASTSTATQTNFAGPSQQPTIDAEGDTQMVDDIANNDDHDGDEEGSGSGEEEDELEEDELEEDQYGDEQEGIPDHPMDSEFESEDD